MVKAIETHYAGCRFRSRLEARWAVFFDRLGIEWQYEIEGYETPAGRYLPDFYLPENKRWIEVKGGSFTKRDRDRGAHFAEARWQLGEGYRVLQGDIPRAAIEGPGGLACIQIIGWHQVVMPVCPEAMPTIFADDDSTVPNLNEPSDDWKPLPFVTGPGYLLDYGGMRDFDRQFWALAFDKKSVDAALTSARSARFEHGEIG